MNAYSKEFLAECKRLAAVENRRTMVRAFTAAHEMFAKYSRQGQLLIVPSSSGVFRYTDARATTGRLIMLARCGMMDVTVDRWFRDGGPARSKARHKARRKFKGHMVLGWRDAWKLVKPADRRAPHVGS